ncbi:MAG: hypothetical protein M1435_00710 [Actinobacteria bacterium]|nr:hypothetical protein [Actinomycetota bacterium]
MFSDFPVLYVDGIVRRTLVSCMALGVAAVAGGLLLNQWLAGAGVVLGLGGATLNHRLFQASTVRHIDSEGHLEKRPYAGSVAARLGALTAVAFVLLFFVEPMGFGMIGGLVAFQVLLMMNALGAMWSYHKRELAGLATGVAGRPGAPAAPLAGAGEGPLAGQTPGGEAARSA